MTDLDQRMEAMKLQLTAHNMQGEDEKARDDFFRMRDLLLRRGAFEDLERMRWSSRSSPSKGPKRLCKFCLLGIVLPVVFLCIPLYMRYQALRPHLLTLSPADMKLLNQVDQSLLD